MISKKKILLFVFITGSFMSSLYSQTIITRFTPDSIKFYEEMKIFLTEARKKDAKDFFEEFTPVWYGGVLEDDERKLVYRTCNFMLEKKMQPFPDFKSYLFSLMSFFKSDQPRESFLAWQESLEKLINSRNKKKFSDYLDFCSNLFAKNNIYESNTTAWHVNNRNYQFMFDDEPYLIFPGLELKCFSKNDSAVILNTKGVYYPNKQKWVGTGGTVTWERAGFQPTQVYAELKRYEIETKSSSYEADSVVFYNSIYFDKPLKGKLTEKVLANVTEEKATYPRFESYDKRLIIKDIVKSVDYDGGFSQHGVKFIGSGSEEEDALVIFKRENKPFLVAASKNFIIRPEKIVSERTKIVFYLSEDSVAHPGIRMSFLTEERLLSLTRGEEGIGQSPYFNSYHNLDMFFEQLKWKIDEPTMEIGTLVGTTDHTARFESIDYYQESRFDRMQGIDNTHPLVRIKACSRKNASDELFVGDLASCMGISVSQVRLMIIKLSIFGFVNYDYNNDKIRIEQRLNHYINAKSGKEDYDVIEIKSNVSSNTNGRINLLNNEITLNGVESILLSDTHNVYVVPKEQTITLQKNRNFTFSGIVNAGKFEYYGKELSFDYLNFKLELPNIDSIKIKIQTEKVDEYNRPLWTYVTSIIEHGRGFVNIDEPGNKASIKHRPQYPIFNSTKDSYVFYEKSYVQKGVYKRGNFHFHLEPFVFDSLSSFDNSQLRFKGTFTSAGIFPEFDDHIYLQPDYSLGFVRPTPASGYAVYGEKGKFFNNINLSNRGLRGDGTLNYLTSTTQSSNFIFYPDSMNTLAQSFVLEEQLGQVEYPPVVANNVGVHWEPFNDFMTIWKISEPITMYDGNSKLHGALTLTPKSLTGKGEFKFEGAELLSDEIKFKFSEFDSDTAEFRLMNTDENAAVGSLSFATNNVKAHVDFKQRKADFESNGEGSFVQFPENKYIAYMDKFTWYMDTDDIELSAKRKSAGIDATGKDVQLEGAQFISVHPDQDSLKFSSPAARYDVKKHIIYGQKVQFLNVADALIYPDSGLVIIDKNAKMRTLENSVIVANNINRYHTIYNASVNVYARKKYSGSGYYDYIDENKNKQSILFSNVQADTTAQTFATGTISEKDNFTLSAVYKYKGDVLLTASKRYLNYSGTAMITHTCDMLPLTWFKFSGEIDPEEIYIPIDSSLVDDKGNVMGTGLMLNSDSVHMYSTFLTLRKRYSDNNVLGANGYLFFDKSRQEYKISNLKKLSEISMPGNLLSLSISECQLYGEGKINLGTDLGRINTEVVGNYNHYLEKDSIVIASMFVFDFFFVESSLEYMAKKITEYNGLEGVPFDRPVFERGLQEIVGKEEAGKLMSQLNLYGSFKKLPDELNKPIFFTDVRFIWDKTSRSYKSIGKIGIGNVFKKQINKYVDGYIEIEKKRSGDIMNIYLQLDSKNWYFFSYNRNVLYAISSDDEFNNPIKEAKSDKKKLKTEKGQAPYQFMLSPPKKKDDFKKRFEKFE